MPEVTQSPDFQRKALVTILGIVLIVGAFWTATRPVDTLATPLATLESGESGQFLDIYSKEIINEDTYLCGILGVTHPNSFRVWYELYSKGIMADKPESFRVKRPGQEFVERFWGEEANTLEPVDTVSCMPLTSAAE